MAPTLRPGKSRWRGLGQLTPWLLLVAGLLLVRLSKGAGFSDAYALLSRPFWPGSAQREWVTAAVDLEERSRLQLLESDNSFSLLGTASSQGHRTSAASWRGGPSGGYSEPVAQQKRTRGGTSEMCIDFFDVVC